VQILRPVAMALVDAGRHEERAELSGALRQVRIGTRFRARSGEAVTTRGLDLGVLDRSECSWAGQSNYGRNVMATSPYLREHHCPNVYSGLVL
jgi:hypothetical protein